MTVSEARTGHPLENYVKRGNKRRGAANRCGAHFTATASLVLFMSNHSRNPTPGRSRIECTAKRRKCAAKTPFMEPRKLLCHDAERNLTTMVPIKFAVLQNYLLWLKARLCGSKKVGLAVTEFGPIWRRFRRGDLVANRRLARVQSPL
jgi:hypothetical protein